MIIDAHAHIYPSKIAEKATKAIGDFYDIEMSFTGTTERLINEGKEAGIERFVVHSVATKPEQVHPINLFIKEQMELHKEFIGFMTLNQDLSEEEIAKEVDWAITNGFKGVKLHPDFQKFNIDEEKAHKIYRGVNGKLPILFHTGDNRFEYSKPFRLANIAKEYKKSTFIGAHFGGYRCWDQVDCYLGLDNVFFDTSSSLKFIGESKAKDLIDKMGYEKFFFGTDFPMWNATEEKKRFLEIKISDDKKEAIFHKNIEQLLSL